MKEFLLQQMLKPAINRIGTATGTALTGYGMSAADLSVVQAAAPVLLGFLFDLAIKRLIK